MTLRKPAKKTPRAKEKARAPAKKTPLRKAPPIAKTIQEVARELDQRHARRPMALFQILGKVVELGAVALVMAIRTPEQAIRAAGGSLLDAMNGHVCGPDCRQHFPDGTPEERKAKWEERLAAYDKRVRNARPSGWKPCARCLELGPDGVRACTHGEIEDTRCRAVHGMVLGFGLETSSRCIHTAGHAGAHQDERWRDNKPGAVSWWS